MSQKIFLVIDTDTSWIPKFEKRLKLIGLDNQFSVKEIFPDTSLRDDRLVEECMVTVTGLMAEHDIAAIFVDIVIKEEGVLDALGISIARELRSRWPEMPLFSVTGKLRDDEEQELFSEATVEDVDGVFAKVFLYGERASASRFRDIIMSRRRRGEAQAAMMRSASLLIDPRAKATRGAFGEENLEPRMRVLVEEIGASEFWGLLGVLLPHAEGTLSVIDPGRSGAVVIKASAKFVSAGKSPTRVTTWVIKMARDIKLLQHELDGYAEIAKSPLRRDRYPRLLREEVKVFGGLCGLAIQFEGQCETLLEFFTGQPSEEEVETVASDLMSALREIYGDVVKAHVRPWGRFYRLEAQVENRLLGLLQDIRSLAIEDFTSADQRRLEAFIVTGGRAEPPVSSYEDEVSTVHLHGDLNVRNILVRADRSVVLIDFASRRQGHVAADVAKLERDLLLRVADWGEKEFYDWNRMKVWSELWIPDVLEVAELEWLQGLRPEYRRLGTLMSRMRGFIGSLGCRVYSAEYSIARMNFFLLGSLIPELSIQKRVFALRMVSGSLLGLGKSER